jgi:CHAD domain-containing protein
MKEAASNVVQPRVLEAGAQVALVDAIGRRYEALRALLGQGPESLKDSEVVHDLRVGSRRLGEAARLLEPFMDKPAARAVQASLKALRHAMGELRDDDVARAHLLKWRMPAALRQVAREVAGELEAARPARVQAAEAQMTSASLTGTMVILARVLEERGAGGATEKRLEAELNALLKKREKQLRRAFGRAAKKQTPRALHAARIAGKKVRYLLELAADATGDHGVKKKVAFLKGVQKLLGDHHDTQVISEQLAGHVKMPQGKAVKGLAVAWGKWSRETAREQGRRAAEFFARSYEWVNG